jgi:hypothetical protein
MNMNLLVPSLTALFIALCVYLTRRIVTRRERWAKRVLGATLALPVLYVASFGPAVWLVRSNTIPPTRTGAIYKPLIATLLGGPDWLLDCATFGDWNTRWIICKLYFDDAPQDLAEPLLLTGATGAHVARWREAKEFAQTIGGTVATVASALAIFLFVRFLNRGPRRGAVEQQ